MPRAVVPMLQAIGRIAEARGMSSYAVGGCVRDWLLGCVTETDLDVTVEGQGIDVARAAAHAFGGTLRVHAQFGTATILLSRAAMALGTPASGALVLRVDLATCRREAYAEPAAYPRVTIGTLEDDLFRRDFTMNAMAVAMTPQRFGRLIDPFGGLRDLRRRRLRILHPRSFLDDPSRILRGVRFAQRFHLQWERGTARALQEAVAAEALGWLNPGRWRKELDRMREEPDPRACVRALAALVGPRRLERLCAGPQIRPAWLTLLRGAHLTTEAVAASHGDRITAR